MNNRDNDNYELDALMKTIASVKVDSRKSLMQGDLKTISLDILALKLNAMKSISTLFENTIPQ